MGVKQAFGSSLGGKMIGLDAKDPKRASELKKKASKKAELKRLSRGSTQETTLTSPRGVAGMGLKKKLGQ